MTHYVSKIVRAPLVRLALAAAVTLLLVACVPGTRDLQQQVDEIKARKGTPVEPLPPMKEYQPYPYTAYNLRDPFADIGSDSGEGNGDSPESDRVKEILEGFPLDALDMVGTMGMGDATMVLIKDPDGVVHRVTVGNYMGQNEGRISAVFEDHVDLVELVPNGNGGWMERPASIALDES